MFFFPSFVLIFKYFSNKTNISDYAFFRPTISSASDPAATAKRDKADAGEAVSSATAPKSAAGRQGRQGELAGGGSARPTGAMGGKWGPYSADGD